MAAGKLMPFEGRKVGLALGSGAARGWAHIGVIHALAEEGIHPDVVAGSSIGAVVGAAYASDRTDRFEDWVRGLDWQSIAGYFDFALRGGLIKARKVFDALEREFAGGIIEDLPRPYAAVATDLATGNEVWLREGSLYDAVRASVALPGMVTPASLNGRWLVDGGLVNPVPVSVCRALGADLVIAVDLNTTLMEKRSVEKLGRAASGASRAIDAVEEAAAGAPDTFQGILQNLATDARKRLGLDEAGERGAAPPSIYNVIANSVNIMQIRITRSRMAGDPPDILVAPRLADFGLLDFDRADEAIEEGKRATERVLAAHA